MPDRVIDEADEVVVVDLTPEALQARIIEGKVFPAGSVPVALERFFTKDNLDVLREMALLQVVEEVEAHRLTAEVLNDEDRLISNVAAERAHRFLGLVKPDPSANRIIRRAWTIAERLGGELDLLWVVSPEHADDRETDRRVDELRRLAAVFGAHMIVETDRSVARAVARVATRLRIDVHRHGHATPSPEARPAGEVSRGRDRRRRPGSGCRARRRPETASRRRALKAALRANRCALAGRCGWRRALRRR